MINLNELIGKKLSMEVAETVNLNIKVLNENEVEYQFVGTDDGTKDAPVIRKLEVKYDDIDEVEEYSFTDSFGSRFFLSQFS